MWVEWRFRSSQPFGGIFTSCDGRFAVKYDGMTENVYMFGDAVFSFSGSGSATGLDIDEFHTYRFESLDGNNYWFSVDGLVFLVDAEYSNFTLHRLQFSGSGGCSMDLLPTVNEWDFVRYGTISSGERIIASDPPRGYLDPAVYSNLDRFTVTFDSANYVYIDDITVEVTGGSAPVVTQTRRGDTDDVDTVEIVLNRPLTVGERTRFIFNDGQTTNVLNYCLGMELSCGDGCCDGAEECVTCTQDCGQCGDGCCSADETACTCKTDCPATCGDGCCTHDETSDDCPTDCPRVPAVSDWGFTILSLLTLTAGTLVIGSRRCGTYA